MSANATVRGRVGVLKILIVLIVLVAAVVEFGLTLQELVGERFTRRGDQIIMRVTFEPRARSRGHEVLIRYVVNDGAPTDVSAYTSPWSTVLPITTTTRVELTAGQSSGTRLECVMVWPSGAQIDAHPRVGPGSVSCFYPGPEGR